MTLVATRTGREEATAGVQGEMAVAETGAGSGCGGKVDGLCGCLGAEPDRVWRPDWVQKAKW